MTVDAELRLMAEEVEPFPATLKRLLDALDDEACELNTIAAIIEEDTALAARVMQVARSASFAGRFPPRDVRNAVARIGLDAVHLVAVGAHIRSQVKDTPCYGLDQSQHWEHALISVMAVREYAKLIPEALVPPQAFLAALTHDVGKVVVDRKLSLMQVSLEETAEREGISLVDAERLLLGSDHGEIGGMIAEQWNFPVEVCRAVAQHHQTDAEPNRIGDLITLANLVSKTLGVGMGVEGFNLGMDPEAFVRLDIDTDCFMQICTGTAIASRSRDCPA